MVTVVVRDCDARCTPGTFRPRGHHTPKTTGGVKAPSKLELALSGGGGTRGSLVLRWFRKQIRRDRLEVAAVLAASSLWLCCSSPSAGMFWDEEFLHSLRLANQQADSRHLHQSQSNAASRHKHNKTSHPLTAAAQHANNNNNNKQTVSQITAEATPSEISEPAVDIVEALQAALLLTSSSTNAVDTSLENTEERVATKEELDKSEYAVLSLKSKSNVSPEVEVEVELDMCVTSGDKRSLEPATPPGADIKTPEDTYERVAAELDVEELSEKLVRGGSSVDTSPIPVDPGSDTKGSVVLDAVQEDQAASSGYAQEEADNTSQVLSSADCESQLLSPSSSHQSSSVSTAKSLKGPFVMHTVRRRKKKAVYPTVVKRPHIAVAVATSKGKGISVPSPAGTPEKKPDSHVDHEEKGDINGALQHRQRRRLPATRWAAILAGFGAVITAVAWLRARAAAASVSTVPYLATTSSDHKVKLWSLDGFALERTLEGKEHNNMFASQ
eukprot:jgi/Chlat1/2571/Chrsp175S02439